MDLPKVRTTCVAHPISEFGAAPCRPHETRGDESSCCGSSAASADRLPTSIGPADKLPPLGRHRLLELAWILPRCTGRAEVIHTRCRMGRLLLIRTQGRME